MRRKYFLISLRLGTHELRQTLGGGTLVLFFACTWFFTDRMLNYSCSPLLKSIGFFFFFFCLNFWRTKVLFVGPLIPLFWTCGDVCSGFQSQAFLIHVPADMSVSIGGGLGLQPMTVRATHK